MNTQDCREKSREPNIEKEARISMFKFMLVIVVLMQSCRGDDHSIRAELIHYIEALQTELRRELGNWSFTGNISLPSTRKLRHACDCQGVYSEALNTTWHQLNSNCPNITDLLVQLKKNTESLSRPQTNHTCPMDVKEFNPEAITRLGNSLRRLNNEC
ncbi:unnamed protein product [Gadus morhua 'NCC']